jgi:uncharacterized protein (TIGR02588 family)
MGRIPQSPLEQKEQSVIPSIPITEWLAAGVGLTLIIVAIASLLYHALTKHETPPSIQISVLSIEKQENRYLVRICAKNTGHTTAAQLAIEGIVTPSGGSEERSQLTLDYLPGGSERTAALFFHVDPRTSEFRIRPLGYQDP